MVRIRIDDLIEIADGAIGVSLLQVGETAADEILGLFRIDLERAIEVGDGGVDIALLAVRLGAAAQRGGEHVRPPATRLDISVAGRNRCLRRRRLAETDALRLFLDRFRSRLGRHRLRVGVVQ